MNDAILLTKQLLEDNPNITIQEMMHQLHLSGYGAKRSIFAIYEVLKPVLKELCETAVKEYRQPLVSRETLKNALLECSFSESDIDSEIQECYPDPARYAVVLRADSHERPYAAHNTVYNVGSGDFAVEGWVKPETGGGTIVSRKPTAGGSGNGGFLLVLKPDGVIKLATDDGIGFYEVNSSAVNAYDGKFHHILGRRSGKTLEIYFDFTKVDVTERTNRYSGLNINNGLSMTVGATEQIQEPYNYFNGAIGECRVWKTAKIYTDQREWENTDWVDSDLIGMWGFWQKSGEDYSDTANKLHVSNCRFETWSLN